MTDEDGGRSHTAGFDRGSRKVMIAMLALTGMLVLALVACILLIASDGYRWVRAPYPTSIPRDLPSVAPPPHPVGSYADWFGPDDYPTEALRANRQGVVKVALLIGADGAVEACEIVSGSGDASLNRGTCKAAVRHGRFTHARDAKGYAIPSRIELPRVRWALP